jgi:hypothetical protein
MVVIRHGSQTLKERLESVKFQSSISGQSDRSSRTPRVLIRGRVLATSELPNGLDVGRKVAFDFDWAMEETCEKPLPAQRSVYARCNSIC